MKFVLNGRGIFHFFLESKHKFKRFFYTYYVFSKLLVEMIVISFSVFDDVSEEKLRSLIRRFVEFSIFFFFFFGVEK